MYFINIHKHSLLVAQLTEGMGLNIAVTDAFPRSAVAFPCIGGHAGTSRNACSLPFDVPHRTCPPSALDSQVGTRPLGFLGIGSPPPGIKKAPQDFSHEAGCLYAVFDVTIVPCPIGNFISQSGHQAFPNRRMVRRSSARFFLRYAEARSIWK